MKGSGKCDICGDEGEWEAGIYDDAEKAKRRPEGWAVFFPNRKLPWQWKKQNWSSPEFCEKHNLDVTFACPNCHRVK
jgi:hypothetical protein